MCRRPRDVIITCAARSPARIGESMARPTAVQVDANIPLIRPSSDGRRDPCGSRFVRNTMPDSLYFVIWTPPMRVLTPRKPNKRPNPTTLIATELDTIVTEATSPRNVAAETCIPPMEEPDPPRFKAVLLLTRVKSLSRPATSESRMVIPPITAAPLPMFVVRTLLS